MMVSNAVLAPASISFDELVTEFDSVRQTRLFKSLVAEVELCSDKHADCKGCERKAACIGEYDYIVEDIALHGEAVEGFFKWLKG